MRKKYQTHSLKCVVVNKMIGKEVTQWNEWMNMRRQ
jgi:hypothetical protein